jgi:arabinofuranosyltransferase
LSKNRYTHYLIPIALMLLTFAIWLLLMDQFRLDDSFITYRYAQNAVRGWGLVYNHDDAILSTTAPLYAILLAVFSFIISDFHTLGSLIGTTCIGLGGSLIYTILPRRIPQAIRAWAGILYVLSTPLWLSLGMETPLWIMLVLAAIWLASESRWAFTGLLIGLAIFVRPDAALPGALLGLIALTQAINQMHTRRHWWSKLVAYVLVAAVPVLIFAIWGMLTYGSPLPVTLGAKSAQAILGITGLGPFVDTFDGLVLIVQDLLAQSPLYILIGLLLLAGLSRRLPWPIILIVIWGVLHLLTYAILRIAPYRWYYAPLLPGVILLATFGLEKINRWLTSSVGATRRVAPTFVIGFIVLLAPIMSFGRITDYFVSGGESRVMLPIVDWDVYRQVGEWLNQNTPQDATVGVAEVGQVGFYANRWMTDYLGLLQPDVAAMLKRGDLYSWLAEYAPDYLVFQRFRGAPLVLYNYVIENDPWFLAAYQPVAEFDDPRYSSGPVTIFQRVISKRGMIEQTAQMDYDGLRLVGLAVENIDESRTIRVRVDWEVMGDLPENLHLAVKILDTPVVASFDGDYRTAKWQGAFSTWHTLILPENVPQGTYPLHVAVGPTGGPYNGQNVSWFEMPAGF